MRVCFVSRRYFPAISGMSVYAHNLITQLAAMGHDVVMVSQYREDAAGVGIYGGGPPPTVPGVEVHGLRSVGEERASCSAPADFERDLAELVDAVCAAHEHAPFDVVHAQYAYPTGLAAMEASRRLGVPNVVSIQGGDGHWVGSCCATHKAAMEAVLGGAMRLLIGSRSFAREVHDNHGTPLDRFTIVPGAVDTSRFTPSGEPGALGAPPRLLFHGRVDRRKGALDFLDAAAAIRAERPVQVVVSGIGPDLEAARERAEALALPVKFTGYAPYDAAPAVYWLGDVFVSPTHAEGFSNTILEAMASGLPVVSCHAVGVVDCLRDGENGLLVPVADHAALVGALRRILDDEALRRRIAATALGEARTVYAWPAVARQIAGVYEDVAREPVTDGWSAHYDPSARTLADADLSCRFRSAPHLL
ncbi:glycosyltransferase family 4 protein [Acuticoccus sp.]|uniref:glycosyltransferase family 4 protein n=1 Tax=Acuticoccus sp. TaxID=1904378 RepID=UPI003B52F90D